jgi:hypothetical protein
MTKLNPTGVLHSSDNFTSPVTFSASDSGHINVCLQLSHQSFATLDELAHSSGSSMAEVIAKAFVLYKAAAEASHQGKAVGIAPTPDVLETEFVGF